MAKKAAIVQSNYIPWKGYFDLIASVDEFILFDDMQYTKRDWRNRNKIKTSRGAEWLTVPVETKGKFFQKVREARISDPQWGRRHWQRLRHNYGRAPFFREYGPALEPLFFGDWKFLGEVNQAFLRKICAILGIQTRLTESSEYRLEGERSERLAELCRQAGAAEYLSGPSAKAYLDETAFAARGVKLSYMDYSGYPEYRQLFPPFDHHVSVLDLIFNEGPEARRYMKVH